MLAPPELQKWAKAAESVDLSAVNWTVEDSESTWQKLVDRVAAEDRKRAGDARDAARAGIVALSKGSFWEKAVWPGHAEASSAREVLQGAAASLPKGAPQNAAWIDAVRAAQGTVAGARDLLNRAGLPEDSVKADAIIEQMATAIRNARHAIDAPELITATPPAPTSGGGCCWWGWLAVGFLVGAALDGSDEDY